MAVSALRAFQGRWFVVKIGGDSHPDPLEREQSSDTVSVRGPGEQEDRDDQRGPEPPSLG